MKRMVDVGLYYEEVSRILPVSYYSYHREGWDTEPLMYAIWAVFSSL